MSREHAIGDPAELAALYASGAMPPEECAEFEAHLDAGCRACREEFDRLRDAADCMIAALSPAAPPVHVREALMERIERSSEHHSHGPQIWREWESDIPDIDFFVQRQEEAAWTPTGVDGVDIRRLFVDRRRNQMTALIRMRAGSAYPAHRHDGPEECLVLAGDLHVGEQVFRAGDYQRAARGSRHVVQSTEGGCTLLIVSSLSDEMV